MTSIFLANVWDPSESGRSWCFKTEAEVIEFVSMKDCHGLEIRVFDLHSGYPVELTIHGTWHNPEDPLHIMLVAPDGETVISGYGSDH